VGVSVRSRHSTTVLRHSEIGYSFLFFPGAGTLAFAIRSGVNFILLLARIQRIRKVPRFVENGLSAIISLIIFEQKNADFASTTCALWGGRVPFRCHAWFVPVEALDS